MYDNHQILYSNELINRLSECLKIQENLRTELNVVYIKNKQDNGKKKKTKQFFDHTLFVTFPV